MNLAHPLQEKEKERTAHKGEKEKWLAGNQEPPILVLYTNGEK